MANKKAMGFILEKDQKAIIDELNNEEAGIIFKAIYDYETTKQEPTLDKSLRIVFKQFKVKLDFYDEKYIETCKKNKENIQNYWDKMKDTTKYDRIQSNTMATNKRKENKIKENKSKENERVSDKQIDSNILPPNAPTLADIISYGAEIGASVQYCEKFFDNYESTGWVDKNNVPIKSWKAKLRYWFKDDVKKGNTKDENKKEYDTRMIYTDRETGKDFQYDKEGNKHFL